MRIRMKNDTYLSSLLCTLAVASSFLALLCFPRMLLLETGEHRIPCIKTVYIKQHLNMPTLTRAALRYADMGTVRYAAVLIGTLVSFGIEALVRNKAIAGTIHAVFLAFWTLVSFAFLIAVAAPFVPM